MTVSVAFCPYSSPIPIYIFISQKYKVLKEYTREKFGFQLRLGHEENRKYEGKRQRVSFQKPNMDLQIPLLLGIQTFHINDTSQILIEFTPISQIGFNFLKFVRYTREVCGEII